MPSQTRRFIGMERLPLCLRVDQIAYRMMGGGTALPAAKHALPEVLATRTVYIFPDIAGVNVNTTFTTPALLDNLESLAMPVCRW